MIFTREMFPELFYDKNFTCLFLANSFILVNISPIIRSICLFLSFVLDLSPFLSWTARELVVSRRKVEDLRLGLSAFDPFV